MTGARNAFLDLFDGPSDRGAPAKTLRKADVTSCAILQVKDGMLRVDCPQGKFWVNRSDVVTDDVPAAEPCQGSSRVGAPRNMGADCP